MTRCNNVTGCHTRHDSTRPTRAALRHSATPYETAARSALELLAAWTPRSATVARPRGEDVAHALAAGRPDALGVALALAVAAGVALPDWAVTELADRALRGVAWRAIAGVPRTRAGRRRLIALVLPDALDALVSPYARIGVREGARAHRMRTATYGALRRQIEGIAWAAAHDAVARLRRRLFAEV